MPSSRRNRLLPGDFQIQEHQGQWVVVVRDRVVECGHDLSVCLARAREKHPREEPFVLKLSSPTGTRKLPSSSR